MGSYPTSSSFHLVAPHYDSLMRDVPYGGWLKYLERLLCHRVFEPKRVLDLACGTGSVTALLHKIGLDVTGVDLSPHMIAEARRKAAKKGVDLSFHVQDAAELDLPGPSFDLCVCLFDSLNYITRPDRLARAVDRVFAHLIPGGLFIFDLNTPYALENHFFDQSNTESDDRLRYVWRSEYDAETRLCTVNMRFFLRGRSGVDQEFRETHVQYAYSEEQVRGMLAGAGYTAVESFQAYTLQPVRATTDRFFFVAQRPTIDAIS